MNDNVPHSGKDVTDIEMIMLGDMLRFYELTATEKGRTLQEEMDILIERGNKIVNSVDMVGGMLAVVEVVVALLERGESLQNMRNYTDNSTKFGQALLLANPDAYRYLAREACAVALRSGGCIKCFRLEMRSQLCESMDVDKTIFDIIEGTNAMLHVIAMVGGEDRVIKWGESILSRYATLPSKFNLSSGAKKCLAKGNEIGEKNANKARNKGAAQSDIIIGNAISRMGAVMLFINNGLMERETMDFLLGGDIYSGGSEQDISGVLVNNISQSSIDFLNKIGEKLDE